MTAFLINCVIFAVLAALALTSSAHSCNTCDSSALAGLGSLKEVQASLALAKEQSGLTYSEIARRCNLTNVYTAQLFQRQAQLKGNATEKCLMQAVPALQSSTLLLMEMQKAPARRFDPALLQDPLVYRFYEAVMHSGEAMRAIVNEEFGDGIMSAIDFYMTIDRKKGKGGEARVVVTMNGKYLPFVEQRVEDNVAQLESVEPAT